MRAYELFRVVGSGSVQELLCQTIDLPTAAEEIKEIRKTVIIDNCMVVFDKVIIDGRLRKDIMFKAADSGFPQPGQVTGCGGILTTVAGTIQDIDVDIAFTALIPVKGACPEDHCVVLEAFVEGEKEEPANIQATGSFTALVDKSIVFICVKVVRDTVTSFHDDDDDDHDKDHSSSDWSGSSSDKKAKLMNDGSKGKETKSKDKCGDKGREMLCPKRRSTGTPIGGGRIAAPRPGAIPGSWIGPTLLFAGVLNPGIPTTQPGPNVILNPQTTQVQVNNGNG